MSHTNDAALSKKKRRKIITGVSLIVLLVLTAVLTVMFWNFFNKNNEDSFREYVEQFGITAPLVFLAAQMLQIFLPLLPGELMEISAGYLFGAVEGTFLCFLGIFVASAAVFWLVRRFGRSILDLYFDVDKIYETKLFSSEKRIKRVMFFLFFLPGTPKDLLTFFAPLSKVTLPEFLWITMIARIPSVVSSTIGGHFLVEKDYLAAAIVFVITGTVSLVGIAVYNKIMQRYRARKSKNETPDPEE